ncbi:MAG: class I SAM-dependent methyltransferase [Acidobacteriota bacterium]
MRAFFARLKGGTEILNYGRETLAAMAAGHARRAAFPEALTILDLGAGTGADLLLLEKALAPRRVRLCGVEVDPAASRALREKGVEVFPLDLERDRLPFPDGTAHLVVANQVLEHTKEIFWITAEAARVLAPGGAFLVGIPNLASLHNRVLLLLGLQPSSIEWLGPHVRGATADGFRRFAEAGGFFRLRELKGGNFYPFPPLLARPLARLLPRLAVSLFFLLERTAREGSFLSCLEGRGWETPYYRGGGGEKGAGP